MAGQKIYSNLVRSVYGKLNQNHEQVSFPVFLDLDYSAVFDQQKERNSVVST